MRNKKAKGCENIMEEIKQIIYDCIGTYTIQNIILFGSRASGNYNEDSDYDILVVLNEDIENDIKIKLSCVITRELANNWVNADIIVKSQSELEKYKDCIGSVVREALRKGVVV